MFSAEEIEALVLGSQWVAKRTDTQLGRAAQMRWPRFPRCCLRKCATVWTAVRCWWAPLRRQKPTRWTVHHPSGHSRGYKLGIDYCDLQGNVTQRTIWPLALGYFDHVRMLAAWCETRQDFRHFRTDRILPCVRARSTTRAESRNC
jgi:predicted DNA-binding transcriptional regulator YafY